jgi:hypothetical protein
MSVSQAGAASNSIAPYALNWRGLSGYQHNSSADQAVSSVNAASKHQAVSSNYGGDSAQVTLSDAARALAALTNSGSGTAGDGDSSSGSGASGSTSGSAGATGATGSSDFDQEAQYLGGVADASLVALGIITPDQQSGTQITFNSLSYNVSSSASAGVSQQNGQAIAAYSSEQQAEFVGQGQITTADGRTFDFQIEVDLDQSQQAEAVGSAGASGDTQSASNPSALAANSASSGVAGDAANASSSAAPSSSSSGGLINWDEILKESKGLFDLLASLGQQNQADSATAANTASASGTAGAANATNASAGTAGASGNTASASQGSATSSGNSQNPSQNQAASIAQAA